MCETLRQTLFILAFYILVPVLYLVDLTGVRSQMSFLWYMSNGLNLTFIILVIYLAWNMFRVEYRDGAMEYMLSLPVSSWKKLMFKVLPRIFVLLPFYVLDLLLVEVRLEREGVIFGRVIHGNLLEVIYLVVLVFLLGFVLGLIGRKGWTSSTVMIVMLFGALGTRVTWFYSVRILGRSFISGLWEAFGINYMILEMRWGPTISYLTWLLLVGFAIRPLIKRWELGSPRERELVFVKRAFLPMLLMAGPLVYVLFRF